jgi:hypothetical protein
MAKFEDNEGRQWSFVLELPEVKRLRDDGIVDLFDHELLDRFVGDAILKCQILYSLCEQEADNLMLTEEGFMRTLGKCWTAADAAWLEALTVFFESLGLGTQAAIVQELAEAMHEIQGEKIKGTVIATAKAMVAQQLATVTTPEGPAPASTGATSG